MAIKSTYNRPKPAPESEIFPAFCEPRSWALKWDVSALQSLSTQVPGSKDQKPVRD